MGSSTHWRPAPSLRVPYSSPMIPSRGNSASISLRIAASAARSASVTGDASAFAAMVEALFAMAKLSVEVMVLLFGTLTLWLGFLRIAERAGLVAGVAAGAFGIFAASLHCPDNDIVHIGLWHSGAVIVTALAGRLLVPRLIRW